MISEAKAFWDSISGKVKELIHAETNNSMRVQRYDVTTAPNGTVIGVTQPFGSNQIFIPYSKEVAGAAVGDTVLVAWWGSMSNARAYYFAEGYEGVLSASTLPAGGASGDALVKTSASDFATGWKGIPYAAQTTYTSGTRDLNTFTTPGIYYFSGGTTLSNNPGNNGAGWLMVLKTNSTVYKQIWFRNSSSAYQDTYVRLYSSSGWATWKQIAPNMAWKKLWTNASPTSNFAAQTVALTLTDYDAVIVMFKNDTSTDADAFALGFKSAESTMLSFYNYRNRRTFTMTDTGVTFKAGYNASQTGNLASNNGAAIPNVIYGIRGVS